MFKFGMLPVLSCVYVPARMIKPMYYASLCVYCVLTIQNVEKVYEWLRLNRSEKQQDLMILTPIVDYDVDTQMTHVTKNGCKSFHRFIARVQYDDGDFFYDCVHNHLDSDPNASCLLCFPFAA